MIPHLLDALECGCYYGEKWLAVLQTPSTLCIDVALVQWYIIIRYNIATDVIQSHRHTFKVYRTNVDTGWYERFNFDTVVT